MTTEFQPNEVRYIKLGQGGAWAMQAIKDGIVPFGYSRVDHALCEARSWDRVRDSLIAAGRTTAGASQGVRELSDFYDQPSDTLWVTFANGHLWWAFAEQEVISIPDFPQEAPTRFRRTIGGWKNISLTGEPLTVRSLSSALTRTAGYRMTICRVERADYLLRRIRGEDDPLHRRSINLQKEMEALALGMIRQLHWQEFETLVDLLFARGGWRRTSVLGEDMPDVDLILDQPLTGETAWVQVKTGTRQAELDDYLSRYRADGSYDRFYFLCHTSSGPLRLPSEPHLHLWYGEKLAAVAIDVGLFSWLSERVR